MNKRASRPRGIVSIADALIALDGLSGDELERAWGWLRDMIGIERRAYPLDREPGQVSPKPDVEYLQTIRDRRRRRSEQRESREAFEQPSQGRASARRRDAPTIPFQIAALPFREDPDWLTQVQDRLGEAKPFRLSNLPSLQPLFEPRRTRSVLSGALATTQADGELDIDRILERVTHRQPFFDLPRRKVPTTRLGLQLLLDRGEAMTPYLRDQELLVESICKVFGEDLVDELRFVDSPLEGVGTGPVSNWVREHRSPPPGTPLAVLTDLGIGRSRLPAAGVTPDEWLRFARQQRVAGCPLLAIVPYELARVPPALRTHFRVLPWSRSTTIAIVRQLIGQGLEGGR
ncbi:MAG: hypothetical protein GY802_06430 [Gammaproteobacteria bacterium]|nr:hypothetical protein [Gammaproteobacteria bacterium]